MSAASSGGKRLAGTLLLLAVLLPPQIWAWWTGLRAVRAEYYFVDAGYDVVYGMSGMEQVGFRTAKYHGRDGVRMGAGTLAFGAMLSVWTTALLLHGLPAWPSLRRILALLSLLLAAAGVILHFPPWSSGTDPTTGGLWAFLILGGCIGLVSETLGRRLSKEKGARLKALSGIVLLAGLGTSLFFFGHGAFFGLLIGMGVMLGLFAHVAALRSPARKKVSASRPAGK